MNLSLAQIFVYTIAFLELAAGIAYYFQGNTRMAIVWASVGLGNVAMGGIK
jgi:hypothetical protein